MLHPNSDEKLAVNCPLTRTELESALSSITKLKVPEGPDRVSYRMLRGLPMWMSCWFHYRRCWEEGAITSAVETHRRYPHP